MRLAYISCCAKLPLQELPMKRDHEIAIPPRSQLSLQPRSGVRHTISSQRDSASRVETMGKKKKTGKGKSIGRIGLNNTQRL